MAKLGDLLSVALVLISIYIFFTSLKVEGWIKLFGMIGAIILFIVEMVFLYQTLKRRN